MVLPYLGETCVHCKGQGYIRKCSQCNGRNVLVVLVPGLWWEWRCEDCGWVYRCRVDGSAVWVRGWLGGV